MAIHILHREQLVPRSLGEVFSFFADAWNLERITPPWLNFHVVTPGPIELKAGARIDYRLRIHGVPLRWRTEITDWRPNERFVDQQMRGPYRLWRHLHLFRETPKGVWMTDVVHYILPLNVLGSIVHRLFVRRDLDCIFDYRARVIAELFSTPGPHARPGRAATPQLTANSAQSGFVAN